MNRALEVAVRASVGAVAAAAVAVFLPIAFGLMPDRFFGASCTAGEALGTRLACYRFMWNTITVGVFIGIIGPMIGTFLVHREMALIGETLAHTAFAGVAFGTLLFAGTGWDVRLLLVALGAAIVGALGVQALAKRTGSYGDVPIAIVLTGSFALGTLFIDLGGGFAFVDINSYLFGNISITDDRSVTLMALVSLAVVVVVSLAYKQLLFITFDERAARVARVPVAGYNGLLIVLTALVIVGSMQILGVILVAAMLVVPVAAASLVAGSFRETLYTSIVVGEFAVLSGLVLSWLFELRPGGTIVVVAIACYLLAVVRTGRTGSAPTSH
ncbi:iron chelate uptake ABC transporter family permease subunit [Natronorubrum sp. JWXQ-INN-674]|uniref:Iron chelate uptake ABC transporter family permease subunit n=1 Tax=Natronorubrum halalkaliphilum TaxID=2691917 RepID=A0A6B0VND6_9EURY|nr:metal ABC transporter permease [Natronorubrum halalkaliphilum]MXV62312.1 iron chelate uptake ABC transporter family permease subunit [Natronorubrum halalkaliphilum]